MQLESANDFIKLQSAVIDILVRNLKGVSRKYVGPYLAKKLLKESAGDRTFDFDEVPISDQIKVSADMSAGLSIFPPYAPSGALARVLGVLAPESPLWYCLSGGGG